MKAEDAVEFMIKRTPFCVNNRARALDTLFGVVGTGMEWRDGQIQDKTYYEEWGGNYLSGDMTEPEDPEDLALQELQRRLEDDPERMHGLEANNEYLAEVIFGIDYELQKEMFQEQQDTLRNASVISKQKVPLTCPYPVSTTYSLVTQVPDDVEPDWLDLAIEYCELTLALPDEEKRAKENKRIIRPILKELLKRKQ